MERRRETSAGATASARSKRRVGSKVLKSYDAARLPTERVLAAGGLPSEQRWAWALAERFAGPDPVPLARDLQQTLDVLPQASGHLKCLTKRRFPNYGEIEYLPSMCAPQVIDRT